MKKFFPVIEHINIPSALTTLGLLMGAVTVYFLVHGALRWAILCLFICGVLDLADGLVASRLNKITKFGQQVDSLVDFFTCCIMPIIIVYQFFHENIFVLLAMGFYAICGLWRLAYYNITAQPAAAPGEKKYFTGLPVPGAMMVVTMVFWTVLRFELPAIVMAVVFLAIGVLMISFVKLRKYGLWQQIMWGVGVAFVLYVIFGPQVM
ncbi:MAG: CDP-alcohol phosphatidyltransferase family protein [Defluviitaleaceae bacterium]|nr:CDP-alcohol phosphatidyltransferase family protein [Defluviitaleaceae bacterium]